MRYLWSVDFHKSCNDPNAPVFPPSGEEMGYSSCVGCGFAHCKEMAGWSEEKLSERVYNAGYILVDPEYVKTRPENNARDVKRLFGKHTTTIRHLDYGSGTGLFGTLMKKEGFNTISFDPFSGGGVPHGKYNFITAFEVFEHAQDVSNLMDELDKYAEDACVIYFSTSLSDGRLKSGYWWYVAPRNGHINLFSKDSIKLLGEEYGFAMESFNQNYHVFHRGESPLMDDLYG